MNTKVSQLLNEAEDVIQDDPNLTIALSFFKSVDIDPETVDPEQLKSGIETELEHTDNTEIAKTIALAHLKEKPDYYTLLQKAGL